MRALPLLIALAACGAQHTDTDADDGACGEVSTHTLSLMGEVEDASGLPVQGASVRLEDRGWSPGDVLGTGSTDADGRFRLDALEVTSVEDCWGLVLSYWVVAEEGGRRGEKQVNAYLYNAIDDGSLEADLSGNPVLLSP